MPAPSLSPAKIMGSAEGRMTLRMTLQRPAPKWWSYQAGSGKSPRRSWGRSIPVLRSSERRNGVEDGLELADSAADVDGATVELIDPHWLFALHADAGTARAEPFGQRSLGCQLDLELAAQELPLEFFRRHRRAVVVALPLLAAHALEQLGGGLGAGVGDLSCTGIAGRRSCRLPASAAAAPSPLATA